MYKRQVKPGQRVLLIDDLIATGGTMLAGKKLLEKLGATVVNMRWAKPLDTALLLEVAATHQALVTVEDACLMGGAGSAVSEALLQAGLHKPLLQLGLKDEFTEHGDVAALMALQGLDAAGIEATVMARFSAYLPERAAKVVLKSVA